MLNLFKSITLKIYYLICLLVFQRQNYITNLQQQKLISDHFLDNLSLRIRKYKKKLMQVAPIQMIAVKSSDQLAIQANQIVNANPLLRPQARNPINIVFKNISYTVQIEKKADDLQASYKKEKHILKNVSGIFKAGEIAAILGASGAGKTSLLNIIACRVEHRSEGKLLANTTEYGYDQFGDFANYVMQSDLLMETLTVRETLAFAADLRVNASQDEKNKRIQLLSKRLKLQKCMDVMVGGQTFKGISGGQKKRTSIAFQLISDPQVIMLDEPTSGLDSLTSFIIVQYLTKLAHEQGKTVLMTIHQPSSDIYRKFDRLFLMIEGRLIYQGPSTQAIQYFGSNFQLKCGQFVNPAQFFIHNIHLENPQNVKRYPKYYQTYQQLQIPIIEKQIASIGNADYQKREIQISCLSNLGTLVKRNVRSIIRNPQKLQGRIFEAIVLGLYVGGLYFDAGEKDYTIQSNWYAIVGFFFFLCIASMMSALTPVALIFPAQRQVFLKEQNSRLYSVFLYFLSRNIVQIPSLLIQPLLFALIFYWMIGLASTGGQFFLFYLTSFLVSLCGDSLGLLLGSIITDKKSVAAAVPALFIPFVIFAGFFKNTGNLPSWIGWFQYITPLKYGFIAVSRNQVSNRSSLIDQMNFDLSYWGSIGILIALSMAYRLLSLFFLWLLRTRIE